LDLWANTENLSADDSDLGGGVKVKLHKTESSVIDVPTKWPKEAAHKAGAAWFGKSTTDARLVGKKQKFEIWELLQGKERTGIEVRVQTKSDGQ
jgi:hypothetical protein